ncbi:ATP-binding protein [Aquimonas voraii]|nr:ATP-binding protein [Aquimonas voraii]
MSVDKRISPRDRDSVLQALRAGVVPRRGIQHIQVGRESEVRALLRDIERIADGGAAIRFVVGSYGSGKTFFLQLVRSIALEKGLVALTADLNPDRRLFGSGGSARSLYTELARNVATRTKPDGGAMASVVERFVNTALQEHQAGGRPMRELIDERLQRLSELVMGYDFATVIERYYHGHDQGNEQLKTDAVRWLRGEFSTVTDARKALGVRAFIDDDNIYDALKLFARFTRLAGYGGALIGLDELVNLYKLPNAQSRASNYEQILRILNDALQGSAEHLGVLLGATPETISDPRRGLYSYQALQSRLAENTFAAKHGVADFGGPVVRLANLEPEDLLVLLIKLRDLSGSGVAHVTNDHIRAFLAFCNDRIGAAYFQSPRASVRAFLDLLAVAEARPDIPMSALLEGVDLTDDATSQDEGLPSEEADGADAGGTAGLAQQTTTSPSSVAQPRSSAEDDLSSFKL